jgi:hypothetical protein
MNILDLINLELEKTDYDGLLNADGGCDCEKGDIAPCGKIDLNECEFGYKVLASQDSKLDWYIAKKN